MDDVTKEDTERARKWLTNRWGIPATGGEGAIGELVEYAALERERLFKELRGENPSPEAHALHGEIYGDGYDKGKADERARNALLYPVEPPKADQ